MYDKVLFKETFSKIKASDDTLMEVFEMTVNRKKQFKSSTKRVLLVAAIAVLTITFSVTALATTGIIDFGGFYNSIFSNPEASPYVSSEDMISVNGSGDDLIIEPIAGFIAGDENLYIQLKLTILNNMPTPEAISILNGDYPINLADTTVVKVDENTVIISFKTHSGHWDNQTEMMSVRFNAISSVPPWAYYTENFDSTKDTFTYFGDWEVLVSTNSRVEPRHVEGSFEEREAKVRIEATLIEIQVFGNEEAPFIADSTGWIDYRHDLDGTIKITLHDGRIIEESMIASSVGAGSDYSFVEDNGNRNYGMASYWCDIEFIYPADVIGIELFGVPVINPISGN